jgi:hypothetical protein
VDKRHVLCVLRICNLPTPIPEIQDRRLDVTHLYGCDWKGGEPALNKLFQVNIDPQFKQQKTESGTQVVVPLPEGCDALILCYNKGTGLVPCQFLLPHQLCVESVQRLVATHPGVREIIVIPVRSCEYTTVAKV